jgi:hypothetical protein
LRKRIVFVVQHEPTSDFVRKFFVEQLVADGYEIDYWNVGPIMGHQGAEQVDVAGLAYGLVADMAALDRRLTDAAGAGAVVVPQITRTPQSRSVYAAVTRSGAPTAFFGRGYLPFLSESKGGAYVIAKLLASPLDVARRLVRRLGMLATPITKYDVTFTAGTIGEEHHARDSQRLVPIHHFDVDHTIALGPPGAVSGERTAVFLDDFLPFHPDFAMHGRTSVSPEPYYRQLCRFFDLAEKRWGLRFVIAAHPRSSYADHPFGGREIVRGRTAELVRDADVVAAHGSTSVSFAIIYGKPICLLHSPEMKERLAPEYSQILHSAELLECSLIDMATAAVPPSIGAVNCALYRNYYNRYLSVRDDREHSAVAVIAALNGLCGTAQSTKSLARRRWEFA